MRLLISLGGVLALHLLTACHTQQRNDQLRSTVQHVVICWLHDRADHDAANRIIEAAKSFESIDGVMSVRAGSVLPSHRRIVDSSFDVALVITFTDPQAMNRYLEHPIHTQAVKDILKPLIRKIVVYDIVGQ